MIRILDKNVADKIAAGEVVERPLSIIKELIENSVDAGATSITCEIKKGGKSYIRISDNGSGIPEDQVELAFYRHATSKIFNEDDLNHIDTLGFRGEALASIGKVTRTEVITKTRQSKSGRKVTIYGGEVVENTPTGCPDGTTIVITDLFYNTPARLKFMKSDAAEASIIIDYVSQMALAYKDISFRLINNGNILFTTLGDGNRLNIILKVYKEIDSKNMVPLELEENGLKVSGYISTPAISKNTRGSQIFFVNGRVISSKVIEKGVTLGYKERLFEGRHPIVYLFLEVEPETIDVNIHPNKRQVRFDYENDIIEFVAKAVSKGITAEIGIPNVSHIVSKEESLKFDTKYPEFIKTTIADKIDENIKVYIENNDDLNSISKSFDTSKLETKPIKDHKFEYKINEKQEQVDIKTLLSIVPNSNKDNNENNNVITKNNKDIQIEVKKDNVEKNLSYNLIDKPLHTPFNISDLKVMGVLFYTYIVCEIEDTIYLIDQHAAHERIFYEKLVGQYLKEESKCQALIMPLVLDLGFKQKSLWDVWYEPLKNMGFTIEDFGADTIRVTEIPMFMELSEGESFLLEFIESINSKVDIKNTVVIDKLITMSCKAAVKANDKLKESEVEQLLSSLALCRNPYSCPHGRPTFVKITKYEIERMFKRV